MITSGSTHFSSEREAASGSAVYNSSMNDIATESSASALNGALADLERRVQVLEVKVAALPDAQKIEDHVTERVKASLPPPVDPSQPPSFRDIEIPIPSVQNVVATAKTTWLLFELFNELKAVFWTLFDRRYHMAWITRIVSIVLLALILLSPWWVPFAGGDNIVSRIWDKVAGLLMGLILFTVLSFETRRYKEWRKGR